MSFFKISTLFTLSMLILFFFHDSLDFFPCLLCFSFVLVLVSFNVHFGFPSWQPFSFNVPFMFFFLFLVLLQLHHPSFPFNVHLQHRKSLSFFLCFPTTPSQVVLPSWFSFATPFHHLFRCVYIYVLLVVIPFQFYLVVFIFFSFFILCFAICEVHIVSFQAYIKSNSNSML